MRLLLDLNYFFIRLENDLKKQLAFDNRTVLKFEAPNSKLKYIERGFPNEETHQFKMKKIEKRLQGLHRFLHINLAGVFLECLLLVKLRIVCLKLN